MVLLRQKACEFPHHTDGGRRECHIVGDIEIVNIEANRMDALWRCSVGLPSCNPEGIGPRCKYIIISNRVEIAHCGSGFNCDVWNTRGDGGKAGA